MKIQVTQEDINCGLKKDCLYCPIALAVKRVLLEINYVTLRGICTNGKFYIFPEFAQKWMIKFDSGKTMSPFEFELI